MDEQKRVTVFGGGQLGRMLALAGQGIGVDVTCFDTQDACAGQVCRLVIGKYTDEAAIRMALDGATVATYEFENVPPEALTFATKANIPVYPPIRALETAQDRLSEKKLAIELGFCTPAFSLIEEIAHVDTAIGITGVPAIIKTRRYGYDGKGQCRVSTLEEARRAFQDLGGEGLIIEAQVAFDHEYSIIAARGIDGSMAFYPLIENQHRSGILRVSRAAAQEIPSDVERDARIIARQFAQTLGYVGVLAIELFEQDGALLVNEIAPRVHNSGHWTIEGAATSQFENHLRAIRGTPLGPTTAKGFAGMVNCIGYLPDPSAIRAAVPDAYIHFYGKEARLGRKVGHVTVCRPTLEAREEALQRLIPLCDPEQACAA